MYYVLNAIDPRVSRMIEVSNSIAEDLKRFPSRSAADISQVLLEATPGAPAASGFDVLALEHEDRDVHVLLRRRSGGEVAVVSYIEGEDLGDDIFSFAYLDDENRRRIIGRFDRWCSHHLEEEDEAVYRSMIDSMVPVEEDEQMRLAADALAIAPTMSTLELLATTVHDDRLRAEISKAVAAINATCSPR